MSMTDGSDGPNFIQVAMQHLRNGLMGANSGGMNQGAGATSAGSGAPPPANPNGLSYPVAAGAGSAGNAIQQAYAQAQGRQGGAGNPGGVSMPNYGAAFDQLGQSLTKGMQAYHDRQVASANAQNAVGNLDFSSLGSGAYSGGGGPTVGSAMDSGGSFNGTGGTATEYLGNLGDVQVNTPAASSTPAMSQADIALSTTNIGD